MPGAGGARLSGPKIAVLGVWGVSALGLQGLGFLGLAASTLQRAFWVLAGVHALECLVFLPRLRRAPGPLGPHLLRTFVFGFLHVRELPAAQGASGRSADH